MSSATANSRPLKPGNDGKHIEPRIPPPFMSLMRSSMSQQPGRISEYAVGSMPYSSLGRPATALRPMLGIFEPSNSQTSEPSGWRSTRGARSFHLAGMCPSNSPGGSTRWSSTLTMIMSSACTGVPLRTVVRSSEL